MCKKCGSEFSILPNNGLSNLIYKGADYVATCKNENCENSRIYFEYDPQMQTVLYE